MILFGFEVDTLEIALREQLTLVDKVFIVESTLTHKGVSFISLIPFTLNVAGKLMIFLLQSRKPLMWNKIRETERFDFVNKSKVEHVVFYPPDSRNISGDIWFYEDLQTQAGDPPGLSDQVSPLRMCRSVRHQEVVTRLG